MTRLSDLDGTRWVGVSELWLDPLGDEVIRGRCTISVEGSSVRYTWTHEGEEHAGTVTVVEDGAEFSDTWHQPEPMPLSPVLEGWGILNVMGTYGPDGDWGWRIGLSYRTPTDELVLQMTNVAPWGEEVRAVRMACQRAPQS